MGEILTTYQMKRRGEFIRVRAENNERGKGVRVLYEEVYRAVKYLLTE